ncbi:hypothetical protein HMPREF9713_01120 [Myroides odoratimimus CCUG 12700]|uniref:DUF4391 domain-containing protein n=1 Tax=Myroides odoratimimus TaxID=76832 RepID=UPI0003540010|nr:DUF4391 domain-containing protein [Myroides odoratimimus]EPH12279.1 hypothetical protein HMPREF9713_01120 [Myroides odoratimimus CCUG 12700]
MKGLLHYFDFPPQVLLDLPITKSSLKSNYNCTASEKKILDGTNIQSIRIKALIKQETANIIYYQTVDESYIEIYVIEVSIRSEAYTKTHKPICRLIHKLIPHHCIIITKSDDELEVNFSLATKIINKNHSRLRVVEREYYSSAFLAIDALFVETLRYANADKHDLRALYQYYIQVLQNYKLVDSTKEFKLRPYEVTEQMLKVQDSIDEYKTQINKSVRELKTVTQMTEKVRINSEIHSLKEKIEELINTLSDYGKD